MTNVIKIKRKPRPLQKTYSPSEPYAVTRSDDDEGSIRYEVFDERQNSYRFVCATSDDYGSNGYAKFDAEQIARGLNLLVQYGKEILPNIPDEEDGQ